MLFAPVSDQLNVAAEIMNHQTKVLLLNLLSPWNLQPYVCRVSILEQLQP